MRLRLQLAAALMAAGAAGAVLAQVQPPVAMTNPDWRRRPTLNEMTSVYPQAAKGREGGALIRCVVTKVGTLRNCMVASETPPGSGFGFAAISLSAAFAMKPATLDGQPVEGCVSIPINWAGDWSHAAGGRTQTVLVDPPWAAAPTFEDVAAAYPQPKTGAPVDGQATLRCRVTKEGTLASCMTINEAPGGKGFAAAARTLTKHFRGTQGVIDAANKGTTIVNIPFAFPARLVDSPSRFFGKPRVAALPTLDQISAVLPPGTDLFTMNGRAVVNCELAEGGALKDCGVRSQEPTTGYGDAAMALTPHFRLSAWTTEGLPVTGSKVNLPILFKLSDEEKSALEKEREQVETRTHPCAPERKPL